MIRPLVLGALMAGPMALAGCSAVDMATTAMLERINPLTADPADYEMVIQLPPGLGLEPDSAKLVLQAKLHEERVSETFLLRQTGLSDGGIALAVKPEDLPKMRAVKDKVAAWEAEFPVASSGSLSAGLTPCTTGIPLADDAKVSISLRTEQGGPLRPLMHPYSAQKLVDRIEADAGAPLQVCGATKQR